MRKGGWDYGFFSINSINSYIKSINAQAAWKQKVNGHSSGIIPENSLFKPIETNSSIRSFGDSRLIGIKSKMQSGQSLSTSDLDYLREHYPAEYQEVMKLRREQEEYSEELSRCKTKEDARMLHMVKVTSALASLKSGAISAEAALAKLAMMGEAYKNFTESSHYAKLAENYSLLAEAMGAEEEVGSAENEVDTEENENVENTTQSDDGTHEPQDQFIQSGQDSDPADVENPILPFVHGGKPKPVEKGNPVPVHKAKIGKIAADANPVLVPSKVVSGESYDFEPVIQTSQSKLDRHA